MKKFIWSAIVCAAAVFAACDNKGNSYEFAQIVYPVGESVLYADESVDTLKFATTYDWTLSGVPDWMRISPDSMAGTVPDGYYMVNRIMITVDANQTDTLRSAVIYFNADGKSLGACYTQLHYLNISHPVRRDYRFELQDTAMQVRDSVVFTTYSNDWTLAFQGEKPAWIAFAEGEATSGRAGKHTVAYTLEPNTSTAERTAVLRLTSRGVATDIRIKQLGLEAGE